VIDVAYIVGTMSKAAGDRELRYSLRSLEAYGQGVRRVHVVGHCPDWLDPSIATVRAPIVGTFNAREKLRIACHQPTIADRFLWMHDDFILTRSVDLANYPTYHRSELPDSITPQSNKYKRRMHNTRGALAKVGAPTAKDYDLHLPIIIDKTKCLAALTAIPNLTLPMSFRSFYANFHVLPSTPMKDRKIESVPDGQSFDKAIGDREIFSVGDAAWGLGLKEWLDEMFPEPSKYEMA